MRNKVFKSILVLVGLALTSIPVWAGCATVDEMVAPHMTTRGSSIGISGAIHNCSSSKERYTITTTTATSDGVQICRSSGRKALSSGQNTLYSNNCPIPGGAYLGVGTATTTVSQGSTILASASDTFEIMY